MNFAPALVPVAERCNRWRSAIFGRSATPQEREQERETGFPIPLCELCSFYLYHRFIVANNSTSDFFNSFFGVFRVFFTSEEYVSLFLSRYAKVSSDIFDHLPVHPLSTGGAEV